MFLQSQTEPEDWKAPWKLLGFPEKQNTTTIMGWLTAEHELMVWVYLLLIWMWILCPLRPIQSGSVAPDAEQNLLIWLLVLITAPR